jgi:hypothetical protein
MKIFYDFVEITMCLLGANAAEIFPRNNLSIMINTLNFGKSEEFWNNQWGLRIE